MPGCKGRRECATCRTFAECTCCVEQQQTHLQIEAPADDHRCSLESAHCITQSAPPSADLLSRKPQNSFKAMMMHCNCLCEPPHNIKQPKICHCQCKLGRRAGTTRGIRGKGSCGGAWLNDCPHRAVQARHELCRACTSLCRRLASQQSPKNRLPFVPPHCTHLLTQEA